MSENLIAYWRNWLESDITIPITSDGYIFKFSLFNQCGNDGARDWVCCTSKKKLYSFIKYFILPSVQLSRTIGILEKETIFAVEDYDNTLMYLENSKADNYLEHIETYKRWFDEIDKLEKEDASFKQIRDYVEKISLEVDYLKGIYVELELFENINSVGKTLIDDYEKDEVLPILEFEMELSKEQILELFENIDSNQFMLGKIVDLLVTRLG